MSGGEPRLPGDPFPPALPETAGTPAADTAADALDAVVVAQLLEPRLYRMAGKRILRGRLPAGEERRRAFEASLRALPVDAFFERVDGDVYATVSRPKTRALPANWPVNLLLFLATVITTTWAGAALSGADPVAAARTGAADLLGALRAGLPFSLSLLAILTCHEFGHFFAARRYGLDTTLPFYLPVPPLPVFWIGTLGAVIKMKTPLYNRRILMDVGAAGPLAGALVAIPILLFGILHAPLAPPVSGPTLFLNEPLLFSWLKRLVRPDLPPGGDIEATGLVLAGWFGLFVTALNLLPVGQLDGGHVLYALLGNGQHRVGRITVVALAVLGWFWHGWWVWVVLIPLVVRIQHPPVLDGDLPLDRARKAIGWLTVVLFVLCFNPMPLEVRP